MVDGASATEPASGWRLTDPQWIPLNEDLLVLGGLERGPGEAA
jgi:hypothetical protein